MHQVSMRLGGPSDPDTIASTAWMVDVLVYKRRFAEAHTRLESHICAPGMTPAAAEELRSAIATYMAGQSATATYMTGRSTIATYMTGQSAIATYMTGQSTIATDMTGQSAIATDMTG